jgi:hypothetical protein
LQLDPGTMIAEFEGTDVRDVPSVSGMDVVVASVESTLLEAREVDLDETGVEKTSLEGDEVVLYILSAPFCREGIDK